MHEGQLRTIQEHKRFNVLCCGRRFGKTFQGEDLAIEMMLAGYPVGWFAPEYKYLLEVWNDLKRILDPLIVRDNQTERRIEIATGGLIEMWSLERGNAGRSRKYARAIIDEAAMVPGLMQRWTEDIRPTLTDYRGDAWFLSTPKGRNDFYQLWLKGQDPLESEWMSWQMPTSTNPEIDPAEIEAARRDLPERVFLQEYMAEFLEDSAVFRRIIESATAQEQRYKDYNLNHNYVMGVDLARYEDYTVIAVIDTTLNELCFMERFNQLSWTVQVERIVDIAKRFDVQVIAVDQTGVGDPVIEQLRIALAKVGKYFAMN